MIGRHAERVCQEAAQRVGRHLARAALEAAGLHDPAPGGQAQIEPLTLLEQMHQRERGGEHDRRPGRPPGGGGGAGDAVEIEVSFAGRVEVDVEAGGPVERAREAVEHEAERRVGLGGERGREHEGAERAAVGPEEARAPGEGRERVGLGGAERVLAAGALGGAAGAEDRDVAVGRVGGEAGEAEDVGLWDGGDRRGGSRAAARSIASEAPTSRANAGTCAAWKRARSRASASKGSGPRASARSTEAPMKARTRTWRASLAAAESTGKALNQPYVKTATLAPPTRPPNPGPFPPAAVGKGGRARHLSMIRKRMGA